MKQDRRDFLAQSTKLLFLTGAAQIGFEALLRGEPESAPNYKTTDHWWGMTIDIEKCIGCGNCVRACKEENDVPREPFYFRTWVERYHVPDGDIERPQVDSPNGGYDGFPEKYHPGDGAKSFFVPKLCNHCAHSPCVQVCPVGATVHDEEGLNNMVYNRCIGTRYCSNNCPYKVRRFNFLLYQDWNTPSLSLQRNPDVTVRSRGVMEKCTYCVQRINHARIAAKLEDRAIRDGEVLTACQSACPTEAIVFGNINDPNSRVAQLKRSPLNYGLLEELNTRPRTSYLAVVRNPNTQLEPAGAARTAVFINLVPVFAIALGVLLLGEHLEPAMLVGGAIVVAGIFILNRPSSPASAVPHAAAAPHP